MVLHAMVRVSRRSDRAGAPRPTEKGGADVNQLEKELSSPLHWAAANNHVEAINALLKAGANVDQLNNYQFSPLY